MRSLQFNVGSVLHFTGAKVATILAVDGETFTVHFKDTGEAKDFRLTELLELYANGELTARPASILGRDENEKKRPALLLSDLSERDRAQVIFKRGLVEAMEKKSRELPLSAVIKEFNPYSGSIEERSVFQHVLNNVSFAAGRNRPVSRPTYYRIKYEYQKYGDIVDLASNRSLCGREKFLHHRARALMVEQFEEMYRLSLAQRKGAVHARHSLARLEGIIQDILDEEGEGVKGPSKATIYREYNNLPSYQRSVIEKGPRAARIEYRTSTGREPPEHCLDYVQYDEAHSDIFVFDEDTGAPIGRAIFCWYICCLSGMPLGFYIGFEPWSDVSTMAALRHSVMPKTYVRTHYPDIDGVWPAFGKPRVVQFDNGLTQHANTIKSALHNLNATPEWGKPYWPVFKSDVENMHRQVNATLLLALPGGVPLEKFRHPDYDPSVCGCIGMRHLLYIMHHWIIRRQINTPKGLLKQTPLQRWRDGTKEYLPCLPSSADDIEILFGVKRSAVLNHNGVVVSNVHFSAPWMADFKRRHSSSGEVQISIGLGTMDISMSMIPTLAGGRPDRACTTLHPRGLFVSSRRFPNMR